MTVGVLLLAFAVAGCNSTDSAGSPCQLLTQVRVIPFKGERVDDDAYNALKKDRLLTIPCLVERLDDVTPMRDPRQAPSYTGVTVGDVAFFLLVDFTCTPFDEMFSEDLKVRYRQEGVTAYFRFVGTAVNRRLLQERWRSWLADPKRPKDACHPAAE